MKITDLPQDIRERAEANAKDPKCFWPFVFEKNQDINDFDWEASPEGFNCWKLVGRRKFDEARALLNQQTVNK